MDWRQLWSLGVARFTETRRYNNGDTDRGPRLAHSGPISTSETARNRSAGPLPRNGIQRSLSKAVIPSTARSLLQLRAHPGRKGRHFGSPEADIEVGPWVRRVQLRTWRAMGRHTQRTKGKPPFTVCRELYVSNLPSNFPGQSCAFDSTSLRDAPGITDKGSGVTSPHPRRF
jgi:hypothetical protein